MRFDKKSNENKTQVFIKFDLFYTICKGCGKHYIGEMLMTLDERLNGS